MRIKLAIAGAIIGVLAYSPTPAYSSNVKATKYVETFNYIAGLIGLTVRLNKSACSSGLCQYDGDDGIDATIGYAKNGNVASSIFLAPANVAEAELPALIHANMAIFAKELPQDSRQMFALSLLRKMQVNNTNAEGRLGAWIFGLERRPNGDWLITVREPDA